MQTNDYFTKKHYNAMTILLIIIIIKPLSQNMPGTIEFCTRPLTKQRCQEERSGLWLKEVLVQGKDIITSYTDYFLTQPDEATNLM